RPDHQRLPCRRTGPDPGDARGVSSGHHRPGAARQARRQRTRGGSRDPDRLDRRSRPDSRVEDLSDPLGDPDGSEIWNAEPRAGPDKIVRERGDRRRRGGTATRSPGTFERRRRGRETSDLDGGHDRPDSPVVRHHGSTRIKTPLSRLKEESMRRVHAPELEALLGRMGELEASDLFLTVGLPPSVFVNKRIVRLTETALRGEDIERLVAPFLEDERATDFERKPDLDLAHVIPGKGRFRLNIFRQRTELGLV